GLPGCNDISTTLLRSTASKWRASSSDTKSRRPHHYFGNLLAGSEPHTTLSFIAAQEHARCNRLPRNPREPIPRELAFGRKTPSARLFISTNPARTAFWKTEYSGAGEEEWLLQLNPK